MGYDVHITRRQNWSDPSGPVISLAEWVAVVESDPEMRLDGYAETRVPDGVLRIEREGLAVLRKRVDMTRCLLTDIEAHECASEAVKAPDEIEKRLERPGSQQEMRMLYSLAYNQVSYLIQSGSEAGVWKKLAGG